MSTPAPSWSLHETFLEVMRGGSLSAASRALGVAQPTVRRRIEALEEALDAVLFTRSPNGLEPTEAARAMLPHAEAMASTAHALARSVSGGAGEDRGTVRVAASHVMGAEVLPAILASLRRAHPRIQIELTLSNRNEDLLRRDADLAVRMVRPAQAALVARRVGEIPIGIFASEAYLASREPPRSVEELSDHALIGPDRDRATLEALAAAGFPGRRGGYALRTDHDLAQLAAIRAGVGIGACQVPLAARGRPPLRRLLPEIEVPLEVWVVTHEDLREVRRVRAVLDHLVEELARYLPT